LRGSLQGNDKLDELLSAVVRDTDKLGRLKTEIESEKGGSNG
jgi:predicted component of type VI protein secretion system